MKSYLGNLRYGRNDSTQVDENETLSVEKWDQASAAGKVYFKRSANL